MSFAALEPIYETPPSSSDALYAAEYKDYVRTLKDDIENIAYKNYDASEVGTVSLSFEVGTNGNLIQYNVNDESTSASQKLIDLGIDALHKAGPFAPFPSEMAKRYSKLVFTIVLNFWIKEK